LTDLFDGKAGAQTDFDLRITGVAHGLTTSYAEVSLAIT